mgnify:CR=1 FL=1
MAFSFVLTVSAQANLSALIPMPNKVEPLEGKPYRFVEGRTAIAYGGEELHFVAETLADVNRATYMAFPRALALAEAGWTDMAHRSWESFVSRMFPNLADLMRCGVSVRVPFEVVERK